MKNISISLHASVLGQLRVRSRTRNIAIRSNWLKKKPVPAWQLVCGEVGRIMNFDCKDVSFL